MLCNLRRNYFVFTITLIPNIYLSGECGIELLCVDIISEVTPWNATAIAKGVHTLNNTLERRIFDRYQYNCVRSDASSTNNCCTGNFDLQKISFQNTNLMLPPPPHLNSYVLSQAWPSRESDGLPPIWPGFDFGPLPNAGWVCCWFALRSKHFSQGPLFFLPPQKATFSNSNLTGIEG